MGLFEVRMVTRILDESDNAFPVDGFMNPTFYNEGANVVVINNQEIASGDSYEARFSGCVLKGNFNIKFKDDTGGVNKVILNYGMVIGPFTDPATGLQYSEASKSILESQSC